MRPDRARFATTHVVAWIGWGLATGLAWQRYASALDFALAAAAVALLAGLTAAVPVRLTPARHVTVALTLSLVIAVLVGVVAVAAPAPELLALLSLSASVAGAELRAARRAAALDVRLAPLVRPAPTLLALAIGFAMAALPLPTEWMLVPLGALLASALALSAQRKAPASQPDAQAETTPVAPSVTAAQRSPLEPTLRLRSQLRASGTWLLLGATPAAAAIVALKPALSAIGDHPATPAAATAMSLAIAAFLGPPLAAIAHRVIPAHASRVLWTLAGAYALAAPLARSGTADLLVGVFLGLALAALVALAEIARRRGTFVAGRLLTTLPFAAATGALLAAALLAAVPVTDIVLGASLVCAVAAIGAWVPSGVTRATRAATARPS